MLNEVRVKNYKEYVITSEEGEEKGIFFRNPLQKVDFPDYSLNEKVSTAYEYSNAIKNPIRRFYEILIGNGRIVKNLNDWMQVLSFGGFKGNKLCSPIYFKRCYRKLTAISCEDTNNIKIIKSYGYESEFNTCSEECYRERTTIQLKTGKRIKIVKKDQYHFTYAHLIEEIINTGFITK